MPDVRLKFAVKTVPWNKRINDEDAAGFKRVMSEPYASMIDNWIETDTLPLVPPNRHTKPKCFPGWQGAVSLCKGLAIAEFLREESQHVDAQRMVVWMGANVLPQWFFGDPRGRIAVAVYGGQDIESFRQKYTRWTRSKRTILLAHYGVLLQPEHFAICDTGIAPEIVFAEPFWDVSLAVAAIRTALRNPLFDTAHIRFVGIKDTLDEKLAHYLCKKTAAHFS